MKSWLRLLRISQWVKNGLIFAPAFFAGKLLEKHTFLLSLWAFLAFCLCASGLYIINDILDIHADRHHPQKKHRPLATGEISVLRAAISAITLLIMAFVLSYPLGKDSLMVLGIYALLNTSYSIFLKHISLLEIFVVALGYLLRILGGGAAANITVSSWLFMSVFLLALLISFGKRRAEIALLGNKAKFHRSILADYSVEFINLCLVIAAASSLIMYAIYTVERGNHLIYTTIPAAYGILRYLKLVLTGKGGDPIEAFAKDYHLWIATVLFLSGIAFEIYL